MKENERENDGEERKRGKLSHRRRGEENKTGRREVNIVCLSLWTLNLRLGTVYILQNHYTPGNSLFFNV